MFSRVVGDADLSAMPNNSAEEYIPMSLFDFGIDPNASSAETPTETSGDANPAASPVRLDTSLCPSTKFVLFKPGTPSTGNTRLRPQEIDTTGCFPADGVPGLNNSSIVDGHGECFPPTGAELQDIEASMVRFGLIAQANRIPALNHSISHVQPPELPRRPTVPPPLPFPPETSPQDQALHPTGIAPTNLNPRPSGRSGLALYFLPPHSGEADWRLHRLVQIVPYHLCLSHGTRPGEASVYDGPRYTNHVPDDVHQVTCPQVVTIAAVHPLFLMLGLTQIKPFRVIDPPPPPLFHPEFPAATAAAAPYGPMAPPDSLPLIDSMGSSLARQSNNPSFGRPPEASTAQRPGSPSSSIPTIPVRRRNYYPGQSIMERTDGGRKAMRTVAARTPRKKIHPGPQRCPDCGDVQKRGDFMEHRRTQKCRRARGLL